MKACFLNELQGKTLSGFNGLFDLRDKLERGDWPSPRP